MFVRAFILACSLAACLPLFHPGFYQGHDLIYEFVRIAEYARSLEAHGFPVRWAGNLEAGYGSPIFIFYPPVFLFAAGALIAAGANIVTAVKLAVFSFTFAGGIGMYLFACRWFGRTGAWIAASCYVLAPYHFVDVFVRNSFSEFSALSLAPFVFWSVTRMIQDETPSASSFAAFAASALLFSLSHHLSLLMYSPILLIYASILLRVERRLGRVKHLAAAGIAVLAIVSFYWLPLIAELPCIQTEWFTAGRFDALRNFVSLTSLIDSDSWYSLTWFTPLAAALALAACLWKWGKMDRRLREVLCLFVLVLAVSAFLITESSKAIWQLASISKWLQFPWRFLSPFTFALCFLSGSLAYLVPGKRIARLVLALAVASVAASSLLTQYPPGNGRYLRFQNDTLSGENIRNNRLKASMPREYRPKGAGVNAWEAVPPPFLTSEQPADIELIRWKPALREYQIQLNEASLFTAHLHYFPGWEVRSGKEKIPVTVSAEGLPEFRLSPGEHHISLRFRNTPVRSAANLISIVGLLALAWGFCARAKFGRA